jgi:hypothetical protein
MTSWTAASTKRSTTPVSAGLSPTRNIGKASSGPAGVLDGVVGAAVDRAQHHRAGVDLTVGEEVVTDGHDNDEQKGLAHDRFFLCLL